MFENYTKVATLGKAGHADTLKAGFTSDGVGVVSGVVRALMTY